ncbi:glycosyltransferase family 2 protein [Paraburkholderia acidipaludis]|uniref:glycosyltransferase family 2 protein n=1 Tax=Paraburkholderia acidipaludis TaxID=660537 RepID=UPI0038990654
MTIQTKVSICLPTCNRPELLRACIDSCLMQTHANLEIVIGDDSRDDGTAKLIALHYAGEPCIRYRRNVPALGQARNVASLFERASGDKILLIHDDDFLLPNCVERLLAQWQRHPDLDVAFGKQYETDPHGRIDYAASRRLNIACHRTAAAAGLQVPPGRAGILQMFPNNGWLANAALVKRIGYPSQYGTCCDFVFGTQLCLAAQQVCYVDEYVSCYRKSDVSVSQTTRRTPHASSLAAWRFLTALPLPLELEAARPPVTATDRADRRLAARLQSRVLRGAASGVRQPPRLPLWLQPEALLPPAEDLESRAPGSSPTARTIGATGRPRRASVRRVGRTKGNSPIGVSRSGCEVSAHGHACSVRIGRRTALTSSRSSQQPDQASCRSPRCTSAPIPR